MTAKEIIDYLVTEKGYDKVQTERLESKIDALPEDIRLALENWIATGELTSPTYSDCDVKKILELQPAYKEIAGYLALDWIRRDPQRAIRELQKPYIRLIPKTKGGK